MPAPVDLSALTYPDDLPVSAVKDDLARVIRDHQVVVVAGETGSGKTTQLPKICLEIGRGVTGRIGHTQPRRIAARAVAQRIADELGVELGSAVGYQVRFSDHSSRDTTIKVMTDGILLAELQRDRDLRAYDTIIIDEAHERSLTIDVLLGYLARLLPRRPDLKVIITSATIDPDRFARHFSDADGTPAPVVEVSGRTYPVEIRYRPLVDPDDPAAPERDQTTGICDAVEELWTEGGGGDGGQDILVFCSGEREIRDAVESLAQLRLPHTEVLPLYSRLSTGEQQRIFTRAPHRRIIVATNVAETSLTVPGIRYVVDTGTARISRYSQRTKVQRLPIEPISRASADQRAGRCGRLADGIAIRLYTEGDYETRPEFTDPEILRTGLAAVILLMASLRLGPLSEFAFLDPPDPRQVADGMRLLTELDAIASAPRERHAGPRLTRTGRTLSRLPIDPRLGRMLIEADRLGCTAEVLVIVAALSIQDVRERPEEQRTQADQAHARFRHDQSDFAGQLLLWRYLRGQQSQRGSSSFRRMCREEFLHHLRIREWQDLHAQLRRACRDVGIDPRRHSAAGDAEPDWDTIHQALLAGLLSHIGLREERTRDYLGARGARFAIQPGSTLYRRRADYVMAAELVETSRVWARTNAVIDPAWAERLGAHLVTRSYSEPRWSARRGSAVVTEKVSLYGVPLIADRVVQLGRVDRALARELFIRHALVEGDWRSRHAFLATNRRLVAQTERLQERARRRDLLVGDDVLVAFYDARIPAEVTSAAHFDRWWRTTSREHGDVLTFTEGLLRREAVGEVRLEQFPTTWRAGELDLDVTYTFEPGSPDDGACVRVPVAVLHQLDAAGFDWQVPGVRHDLVTALIRTLPKRLRRHVVPAGDHARSALERMAADHPDGPAGATPLVEALAQALSAVAPEPIRATDLDPGAVPAHLRLRFSVRDGAGAELARGDDLVELRRRLGVVTSQHVGSAGADLERSELTDWDLGDLDREVVRTVDGHPVRGYPALVDEDGRVALRVLADPDHAASQHRRGVRRLVVLQVRPAWARVLSRLSNDTKLALTDNPHGSVPALLEDVLDAAVDALVAEHAPQVRDRAGFDRARSAVRTHAVSRVVHLVEALVPLLEQHRRLREALGQARAPAVAATVADLRAQLDSLMSAGFVARTGVDRLPDLARYLEAMSIRLQRAGTHPGVEERGRQTIDAVEARYADLLDAIPTYRHDSPAVLDLAWLIEELRVQLFAQALGTARPVSPQRVSAALTALESAST